MNCDELLPNYLLYAMGRMEEPELTELRAHLARGCDDCTAGVRAAHAFAYSMGAILDGQVPSPHLRERVLAIPDSDTKPRPIIRKDTKPHLAFWFRPMPVWLGSAMAAACLVLALTPGIFWRSELSNSNAAKSETAAMLAREQRSVALLREEVAKLERTGPDRAAPRSQSVPIFSLEVMRGAGMSADAVQKLTVPAGGAAVVLALPIELVQRATAAEIRNASERSVWTASPVAAGNSESVGLMVPGELLPAGRYSVVLRAGDRTIARVPFQVTLR